MNNLNRSVSKIVRGMPTSDGAGVELTRIIGSPELHMLDPFLMLDHFGSDQPQDYIAGFPSHPHRGFETVTYILNGRMRHKDSAGNEGVIEPNGVQWMTAGRGVIHSEMPEQEEGLLSGFQLWINLPAANKMDAPAYQEHPADELPVERRSGASIRVIAGRSSKGTVAPVQQPLTNPVYFDIELEPGADFTEPLTASHNAFLFIYSGEIEVNGTSVSQAHLAVLGEGDQVSISTTNGAKLILVAGQPLNEPVARGGPFVMNTSDEIRQAFMDYQSGKLA